MHYEGFKLTVGQGRLDYARDRHRPGGRPENGYFLNDEGAPRAVKVVKKHIPDIGDYLTLNDFSRRSYR